MRRSWPCRATCRLGCAGSTISRPPSRICCSAMSLSIPKPFPLQRRRRPSFIRRSRLPMRRGVAHLTLPQDVFSAKAEGHVTSVATLKPHPEFAASAADVTQIAQKIDAAAAVVIMCGNGCHGATDELRALSDRLKAPLIHSFKGKDIMPFDQPRWMGGIGMIGTKAVYNAIMHCDLLLMLGTDYPFSEFLPQKGSVIQIDERAGVLGRRAATELGVRGSVRPTVKLLLHQVAAKNDGE